jgi:hypothetical protein
LLVAVLGYCYFLAARLLGLWRAVRRTRAIRREAQAASLPAFLTLCASRCRAALGLGDVPVLCSERISTPLTVGARQPVVLLPRDFVESASADELTAAVGHEMAHIRRRDFAINLACELLYIPVSFHPAAMLIRRRIDETRELACDEMVTHGLVDPLTYARSLVRIASALQAPRRPRYGVGALDGGVLEERVHSLIDRGPRLGTGAGRAALAAACLALVASGAGLASYSVRVACAMPAAWGPHQDETDRAPQAAAASPAPQPAAEAAAPGAGPAAAEAPAAALAPEPSAEPRSAPAADGRPAPEPELPPATTVREAGVIAGLMNEMVGGQLASLRETLETRLSVTVEGPPIKYKEATGVIDRRGVKRVRYTNPAGNTTFRLRGYEHALRVELVGSFNNWDASGWPLERDGRDWVCRLQLPAGRHFYKFVVDGEWIDDPANPPRDDDGRGNRYSAVDVPEPGWQDRHVTFTLKGHEDARTVVLAGSFNGWHQSRQRMTRDGDMWVCRVMLPPGTHYYKFIVDGHWMTDPTNRAVETDDRGNPNSVLILGG